MIVLVPARGGSKRVVGKNGRELGGRPLYEWSIRIGKELGIESWLSTDREEWGKEAERLGAGWIRRPAEISGDRIGDLEVVEHALEVIGGDVDLVVYLRPTTPFREIEILRGALAFMEDERWTSLRSVEEMGESAYKCFERDKEGRLIPVLYWDSRGDYEYHDMTDTPNQEVEKTYRANGYIDIMRADLIKQGELWGRRKYGYITPGVVEIDTEGDLEYAEWRANELA